MLLSIECIASWSHPGVVWTNLAYLDLSCLSIPKRLRKYFSNYLQCPAVNQNMKVYYLLHLGILILKCLSVETKESRLLLAFNKIRDKLNHNLTPVEVDQYDSTTNILWNSVVLARMFLFEFALERIVKHNWLIILSFKTNYSVYNANSLYPFIVVISILRHYLSFQIPTHC